MKKRYKFGLKLLATLVLTVSLLLVSFGSVITVYGLSIGALSGQSVNETSYAQTLALSGPGGNGYCGQTLADIKTYYRNLNSELAWNVQQVTTLKSQYAPARSNVRVRLVSVNGNGEMTGTLATLGGDWSDDYYIAATVDYEPFTGQKMRIDVGFDPAFPFTSDALGRYDTGYWFVQTWLGMGLVPVAVIAVVLSVVLGIYLLLATGHRANEAEEDGIRLRFFDRWPVLVMAVLLVGAFCACELIWEGFQYTYTGPAYITEGAGQLMTSYPAYGMDFMLTLTALLIWAFALVCFFVLRTLTVRIKAHMLWHTTLTFYICHPIFQFAKRRSAQRQEQKTAQMVQSIGDAVDASFREIKPADKDTGFVLVVDGDKAKEAVHGIAHKAQDAARQMADKARAFQWEGSGVQSVLQRVCEVLKKLWHELCDMLSHMSVMWFGMLWGGCIIAAFWIVCMAAGPDSLRVFSTLLAIFSIVALAWVLSQLSRLAEGAKRLSEGDLSYKIDTTHLRGPFRSNAEMMNRISSGCAVEVERRMKSEHLKTELLTNVSHDIKTPLTSIINYVDLLKKTDPQPEAAREYADVLERQSLRLKKLLEDLIEASKASTGNITVELAPTDAAELLRQAVGEYSERLTAQSLETVLRVGGESCTIKADGRLLWRVFDNLLGNIVKYAMPGTRVYLDLTEQGTMCAIVVKNISREALGIDPDELMERFVRGDASRATEGSGLGLSIARSLTECMGGKFQLSVDGDLFKVTLHFPMYPDSDKTT